MHTHLSTRTTQGTFKSSKQITRVVSFYGGMDLAAQVETNLVHYNLWTDVRVHSSEHAFAVLRGQPPSKLADQDPENEPEWVVPKAMHEAKCSMAEISSWFDYIATIAGRPKRVTLAIVNDDGTVVYYFVHDGVTKPRQN